MAEVTSSFDGSLTVVMLSKEEAKALEALLSQDSETVDGGILYEVYMAL